MAGALEVGRQRGHGDGWWAGMPTAPAATALAGALEGGGLRLRRRWLVRWKANGSEGDGDGWWAGMPTAPAETPPPADQKEQELNRGI